MDSLSCIDQTIEISRKHIADHERLVERQRLFIAELERSGDRQAADNSRAVLDAMEDLLLQLRRELAAAEQRRAEILTENRGRAAVFHPERKTQLSGLGGPSPQQSHHSNSRARLE
jgi:hypothetical protein